MCAIILSKLNKVVLKLLGSAVVSNSVFTNRVPQLFYAT